jgi:hypothetical protein
VDPASPRLAWTQCLENVVAAAVELSGTIALEESLTFHKGCSAVGAILIEVNVVLLEAKAVAVVSFTTTISATSAAVTAAALKACTRQMVRRAHHLIAREDTRIALLRSHFAQPAWAPARKSTRTSRSASTQTTSCAYIAPSTTQYYPVYCISLAQQRGRHRQHQRDRTEELKSEHMYSMSMCYFLY